MTRTAPASPRSLTSARGIPPWPGDPGIVEATERAVRACLAAPKVFAALVAIEGSHAPDPEGFGYSEPWGKGLGLPRDRWFPRDDTVFCLWQDQGGTRAWLCPHRAPSLPTGHARLAHEARVRLAQEAFHALHQEVARLWSAARDGVPVRRALWTTLGLGALHLSERHAGDGQDGHVRTHMIPSGRRGEPWPAYAAQHALAW